MKFVQSEGRSVASKIRQYSRELAQPCYARFMKVVAQNRRARFDLEITDTIEAGMMLTGQEVKSCRAGQASLAAAYVSFHGGKPLLKNAKIPPYRFASGLDSYDPDRDRPLLISKRESEKLASLTQERGVTVVPLEMRAGKYIKLLLGIGKGRKRIDKRERIKEKDMERKMRKGGDY